MSLPWATPAGEEVADHLSHQAGDLGLRGTKLFVFQEGRYAYAKSVFQSMARNSGGGFFQFDERSAGVLAQLLKAVARYASGGRAALEAAPSSEGRMLLEQMR